MKNSAVAIILIFALLVSAVPAPAQEPFPLPENNLLFFPAVIRPCETFWIEVAGNCTHQYCMGSSDIFFHVDPPGAARIIDTQVFYLGEVFPAVLDPYYYYWGTYTIFFSPMTVVVGSEIQVVLFFENGCKADATTVYTHSDFCKWCP